MSRKVCGRLTAAEKIRQMYLKNTSAKTPHLSNHEIAETRKLFTYFDRNKDSHLDQKEYSDLIAYETSNRLSENGLKTIFDSIDQNNDKMISLNEFLEYKCRLFRPPRQHALKAIFKRYDKNKDGLINQEDLRICWIELGEDPFVRNFNLWFEQEDKNKDGLINVHEFESFVSKNFWKQRSSGKP
ncbi:calmodulin-4-like isoform X2 [Cimex lectularius]|uniref:EF-hand domain-containing protein n=1 Tax=Cimex lectularius TaxID=79782 RepID=A0A8I6RID6_CIMLE|nr:calmodulin-4-like isoform X2 [Cimex lectularius]